MHGLKGILVLSLAFALSEGARPEPAAEQLGLPAEIGAFSAFSMDLDGDGTLELGAVSHRAPSMLVTQPSPGARVRAQPLPWAEIQGDRHAVVPCDLDRDGDFELVVSRGGARGAGAEPMEIWEQRGGAWRDIAPELLPPLPAALRARGVSCVDLDGDPEPELMVAGAGTLSADLLFDRQPDGRYLDVAAARGLAVAQGTMGYRWGDLDGDGDLDGVRASAQRAELLLQQPGGRFEASGLLPVAGVEDVELVDLDGDGALDIYVSSGQPMVDSAGDGLFSLQQGPEDVDAVTWSLPLGCQRVRIQVRGMTATGMAEVRTPAWQGRKVDLRPTPRFAGPLEGEGLLAWVDASTRQLHLRGQGLDGHVTGALSCVDAPELVPSLLATSGFEHEEDEGRQDALFLNQGGGRFARADALPAGLQSVAVAALDVDLDGDLDLFLTMGGSTERMGNAPDVLLENDGRGHFQPSPRFRPPAVEPGVAGRFALVTELHGDGYPDLIIFNGDHVGALTGEPMVWENPGGEARTLQVRVFDLDGQARSLSAEVEVLAAGRLQRRLSNPAPNPLVNGLSPTVFGLGAAEVAERVRVTWPDGTQLELRGVPAGASVDVVKPRGVDPAPGGPAVAAQ